MCRKRIQQFLRHAIRIRVKETHPQQVFDLRQSLKQLRQAVAQAQIFAVRSRVLSNQSNLACARGREILRFAHDGFKSSAAERAAQLRNDAERAGMIAALGDLDVRGVARRGDHARRQVVIEKRRRRSGQHTQVAIHGFENSLHFAGPHDGIHFRNLFENLIAKSLDKASGDDELARRAKFLVLGHLQNRVDGLFLRRLDEAARIDDEDLGFIRSRRQFVAFARKNTHHHLAIHEVLRATQANESDLSHRQ